MRKTLERFLSGFPRSGKTPILSALRALVVEKQRNA